MRVWAKGSSACKSPEAGKPLVNWGRKASELEDGERGGMEGQW